MSDMSKNESPQYGIAKQRVLKFKHMQLIVADKSVRKGTMYDISQMWPPNSPLSKVFQVHKMVVLFIYKKYFSPNYFDICALNDST